MTEVAKTSASSSNCATKTVADGVLSHDGGVAYTVAPDVAPLWDDAAQTCVARFMQWLGRESLARNLPVTTATVQRWQSIEDPRDQNLVIDVRIRAQTDEAMHLWPDASDYLGELIEQNLSPASDILTLHIHWL